MTTPREREPITPPERDHPVMAKSRPVPRARLGGRATAALWALRVFVVVVSAMVVYTFAAHLAG